MGLSALLVSTDRAMREPLERGTSDKVRFPRFLFVNLSIGEQEDKYSISIMITQNDLKNAHPKKIEKI